MHFFKNIHSLCIQWIITHKFIFFFFFFFLKNDIIFLKVEDLGDDRLHDQTMYQKTKRETHLLALENFMKTEPMFFKLSLT